MSVLNLKYHDSKKSSFSKSSNDISLIKANLELSIKNKKKLTYIEKHLYKNYINKNKFLPNLFKTILKINKSLVKPAFALFLLFQFYQWNKSWIKSVDETFDLASIESNIRVESNEIEDLAQIIDSDVPTVDEVENQRAQLALTSFHVTKPIVKPAPQKTVETINYGEEQYSSLVSEKDIEEQSRKQNLVKFLTGLISAYRPSLSDPGLIAQNIVETSAAENFDPFYLTSVIAIESRFHSTAQSHVGALGLMQLMPNTAKEIALEKYNSYARREHIVNPDTNIKLGISYLKDLEIKYSGNKSLALAAYNWGPGNVDTARRNRSRIPGSVQQYASTILKRSSQWRTHFKKANEIAETIQVIPSSKKG
ncbi:MAG: lytic transglycosylase domain-containing protein [Proteobacteria bacterium]|nr:lytic transglycosylase domain-containing protein [Pseudomonadota bacterium]